MPEPESAPSPTPTPAPAAAPSQSPSDAVTLARRVGELESENKRLSGEYKEYRERVDPVIETLTSDPELLTQATTVHNKRLGRAPVEPPKPADDKATPPAVVSDPVARKALNSRSLKEFETDKGIDKLDPEKQKDMRSKIGVMIKEMVDPQNNKNIQQVFDEIDPDRFSWYLENAHSLINKQDEIARAKEEGRNEALNGYQGGAGSIGSVPSASIDIDSVSLTPKEKTVARSMGVTDEQYLKNKKRIIEMRQKADDE